MSTPVEVKTTVLCDDVRREDNGKHLLVGVYSGGIVFRGPFPGALASLFVFFSATSSLEELTLNFRLVKSSDGQELWSARGEFAKAPGAPAGPLGRIDLPIPLGPIAFEGSGDYLFQMRVSDGEWSTVLDFSVTSSQP